MSSYRVRDDDKYDSVVSFGHDRYLVKKMNNGKVRVYADDSYYSQTSGGVGKLGLVMRGLDDNILNFPSIEKAEAWIVGGLRLTDSRGDEIDPTK